MIGEPTEVSAKIAAYRASEITLEQLADWIAGHRFADPQRGPAGDLYQRDFNADPEPLQAGTFGEVVAARDAGMLTGPDLAAILARVAS